MEVHAIKKKMGKGREFVFERRRELGKRSRGLQNTVEAMHCLIRDQAFRRLEKIRYKDVDEAAAERCATWQSNLQGFCSERDVCDIGLGEEPRADAILAVGAGGGGFVREVDEL